jgi:RNA polymerase sigma factor (sigma-70 family)
VLESDAELFFVIGNPDRATGAGLTSWPSKYGHTEKQWIADAHVAGPVMLGGRRHELVLGANWSRSDNALRSSDDDGSLPLTEAEMLDGTFPRPAFDQGVTGSADFINRRSSLYAVARIDATDALKLVTGVNATRSTSSGMQYGVVHDYRGTKLTPYLGSTWAFDSRHSLYASYGRIYNPQHQTDLAGAVLPPIEGSNAELGVKGEWMDGQLNGSLAVFRVRQDNTAEAAGFANGRTYYRGVDATSTGFELDVAGTLAPGWEASGGYTQLRIENPDGTAVRTYVPRKTLRLTTRCARAALAQARRKPQVAKRLRADRRHRRHPTAGPCPARPRRHLRPHAPAERDRQARERLGQEVPEQSHVAGPDLLRSTAQRDGRAQMDVLKAPRVLGDVFAEHRTQLMRAARHIVGDAHLAEDLVHDAYLRAMETVPAQAEPAQPLAYAHRVVRNLAIDSYRRSAFESRLFECDDRAEQVAAPAERTPEAMAIDRQALAAVARALAALPERVRRVFEMYRLEGRTQREIGAELGLSAATINVLIREALDQCRAALRAR